MAGTRAPAMVRPAVTTGWPRFVPGGPDGAGGKYCRGASADSLQRAGFLKRGADGPREFERILVIAAGLQWIIADQVNRSGPVERFGLAEPVADVAVDGQGKH
jgi:hypothetical protein